MSNTKTLKEGNDPSKEILELILNSLEDSKAEDIITINLAGKTSVADSMVICSGRSSRQVSAIADSVYRDLKHNGHTDCHIEGKQTNDWVLVDANSVIIHVFRPEVRTFYNLEKMWLPDFRPENMDANAQFEVDVDPIANSEEEFDALDS